MTTSTPPLPTVTQKQLTFTVHDWDGRTRKILAPDIRHAAKIAGGDLLAHAPGWAHILMTRPDATGSTGYQLATITW